MATHIRRCSSLESTETPLGGGWEAAAPGSKGGYEQAATEVLAEAGSEGIPGWGRTLECGLEARGWARQSGLSL